MVYFASADDFDDVEVILKHIKDKNCWLSQT